MIYDMNATLAVKEDRRRWVQDRANERGLAQYVSSLSQDTL